MNLLTSMPGDVKIIMASPAEDVLLVRTEVCETWYLSG